MLCACTLFGLLHSRRTQSHIIHTAAMNQGAEPDIGDAHQTLKYTKAKMREIIAQIGTPPWY